MPNEKSLHHFVLLWCALLHQGNLLNQQIYWLKDTATKTQLILAILGFCINWKLDNICYFSVYQSNLKNNWKQEFWSLLILLLEFMLSRKGLILSWSLRTLSASPNPISWLRLPVKWQLPVWCCIHRNPTLRSRGYIVYHNTYSLHPWRFSRHCFSNTTECFWALY